MRGRILPSLDAGSSCNEDKPPSCRRQSSRRREQSYLQGPSRCMDTCVWKRLPNPSSRRRHSPAGPLVEPTLMENLPSTSTIRALYLGFRILPQNHPIVLVRKRRQGEKGHLLEASHPGSAGTRVPTQKVSFRAPGGGSRAMRTRPLTVEPWPPRGEWTVGGEMTGRGLSAQQRGHFPADTDRSRCPFPLRRAARRQASWCVCSWPVP